ncbi:MAG: ABC-2 transporter permease [Clostridia bacterium]|nr:ABC-2 transporter permease [Clostridia bacterium]
MMTKALLIKQVKLSAHPMSFLFPFFGLMMFIPNYPYSVSFFYVTLGIFFTYQNMREQRDFYFSALLPVKKKDTVTSGMLFCYAMELFSLIFAIPVAVISFRINPNGNAAGIDANAAIFGMGCILYALFNAVFFPAFYRNGYKVGTAFIKGSIAVFFAVAADVILPHIPGLASLDGGYSSAQGVMLTAGLIFYLFASVWSLKRSRTLYEKVDL